MTSDVLPPVDEAVLQDLRRRLHAFRAVPTADHRHAPWDRGVDPTYLSKLIQYWADGYDWRAHERRIRALPWVSLQGGSTPIRAIHQRAGGSAPTVVLLHGWPDSVLRFERALPLLTDMNVVVPSLPGYPFSLPVPGGGLPAAEMAEAVGQALAELGYSRYVLSGGDIGCDVAEALAVARPENVAALHFTDLSHHHFLVNPPSDVSTQEEQFLRRGHAWQQAEGGYNHEQSTKPQTLAVGLGDSPAGLAAWIVEKLRAWTDSGGDVEAVFAMDELLTWVTAYWVSGTIGTSFTPYVDKSGRTTARIEIPTAFSIFPADLVDPPRAFAERFFNVQVWDELPGGGHFGAWERPDDFVRGVRQAVALCESA